MHIPHILCLHESVDEHLGSSHVLSIRNNSATNVSVQVFVWAYVSLGIDCGAKLMGSVLTTFTLLGSQQPVFYPFHFTFSTPSPALPCLFDDGGCEVVSLPDFDLHVPGG